CSVTCVSYVPATRSSGAAGSDELPPQAAMTAAAAKMQIAVRSRSMSMIRATRRRIRVAVYRRAHCFLFGSQRYSHRSRTSLFRDAAPPRIDDWWGDRLDRLADLRHNEWYAGGLRGRNHSLPGLVPVVIREIERRPMNWEQQLALHQRACLHGLLGR